MPALQAAELLAAEGIENGLRDRFSLRPLDAQAILAAAFSLQRL